jgi:hypothetical protein
MTPNRDLKDSLLECSKELRKLGLAYEAEILRDACQSVFDHERGQKTIKVGVPLSGNVYAANPGMPPLEVDTENYGAIVIPCSGEPEQPGSLGVVINDPNGGRK